MICNYLLYGRSVARSNKINTKYRLLEFTRNEGINKIYLNNRTLTKRIKYSFNYNNKINLKYINVRKSLNRKLANKLEVKNG